MLNNIKNPLWAVDKLRAAIDDCRSKHLVLGRSKVKVIEPMLAWHR